MERDDKCYEENKLGDMIETERGSCFRSTGQEEPSQLSISGKKSVRHEKIRRQREHCSQREQPAQRAKC